MAGIFQLGNIISAFAPPKETKQYLNDGLTGQIDKTTASLDGFRTGNAADLAKMGLEIDQATGQIKALAPGDMQTIAGLINAGSEDPFTTYRNVGDYQFGVLDKLSKNLAGQGKSQDNAMLARFGMGGRGGSTYQTNTILDRISKNLSPVYAGALQNIGRDTTGIVQGRTTGAQNVLNLIANRAAIPSRTLPLLTALTDQRANNLSNEIAAESGIGQASRTNYLGTKVTPNKWAAAASAIDDSMNSAVDTGMSLASMYFGGGAGGALGGIMGGMGGGGGGGSKGFGGGGGYNPMAPGQQGAPAGGGNNQQVLALLQQLLRN